MPFKPSEAARECIYEQRYDYDSNAHIAVLTFSEVARVAHRSNALGIAL